MMVLRPLMQEQAPLIWLVRGPITRRPMTRGRWNGQLSTLGAWCNDGAEATDTGGKRLLYGEFCDQSFFGVVTSQNKNKFLWPGFFGLWPA